MFASPVNWRDETGTWHEIDATLVEEADGRLTTKSAAVGLSVGEDPWADDAVTIEGDGFSLALGLESVGGAAKKTESRRVPSGDETGARFDDIADGASMSVRSGPGGVELSVEVDSAAGAGDGTVRFDLRTSGLERRASKDGAIEFVTSDGTVALRMNPGLAQDSAAPESSTTPVAVSVEGEPEKATVVWSVDRAWLQDDRRVFPVLIDPSTTYYPGWSGAQADAYVRSDNTSTNYDGSAQLDSGNYVDKVGLVSGVEYDSYLWYDLAILDDKTIYDAEWWGYAIDAAAYPTTVTLRPVSSSWDATTVTYGTKPSAHSTSQTTSVSSGGAWVSADVTSWVEDWADGTWSNYGITLDTNGSTGYVRFGAAENSIYGTDSGMIVTYLDQLPDASDPIDPIAGERVTTTTPTLTSTVATDPDDDWVVYGYSVSTDPDAMSGNVVRSGWLWGDPEWTVPSGSLVDGTTYYWTVWTYNYQDENWTQSAVESFRVDQRLGDGGTSPMDSVGPFSVNLATGNVSTSVGTPTFDSLGGSIGVGLSYNEQATTPHGLRGKYYTDCDWTSSWQSVSPSLTRTDPAISFDWGGASPGPGVTSDDFCARWDGYITVPSTSSGWYLGLAHDNGARLWVDNVLVVDEWSTWGSTDWSSALSLTAGQRVAIRVEYYDGVGGASLSLHAAGPTNTEVPADWLTPGTIKSVPDRWDLGLPGATFDSATIGSETIVFTAAGGGTTAFTKTDGGWAPDVDGDGILAVNTNGAGEITSLSLDLGGHVSHFDSAGAFTGAETTTDTSGTRTSATHHWNSAGQVDEITDPVSGRKLTLVYSAGGSSSGCSVPSGFSTPAAGLLCRVWFPVDTESTSSDSQHRAQSLLYYDSSGRLARFENPGGEITDFAYDSSNRLVKVRDSLAADVIAAGGRSDDDTARTVLTYGSGGYPSQIQQPAPAASAARPGHHYSFGAGTTDFAIDGVTTLPSYSSRSTWDSQGRVLTQSDASAHTTTYTYDDGASTTALDDSDQLLATVGPDGMKTTVIYNTIGWGTDSYGPAPSAWFGTDNRPLTTYLSQVPHSSVTYDLGLSGSPLTGLAAQWWNDSGGAHWSGAAVASTTTGAALDYSWGSGSPTTGVNANDFSVRFTGSITFPTTDSYVLRATGDDDVKVWLDDELVVTGSGVDSAAISVVAGVPYRIRVDHFETTGSAGATLSWKAGSGSFSVVPAASLSPRYGIVSTSTDADGNVSAAEYSDAQHDPALGLGTAQITDPTGANLRTVSTYENGGYQRPTGRQLPGGNTTTYSYYSASDTTTNACDSSTAKQSGMMRYLTKPDPDGGGSGYAATYEYRYDNWGRRISTRYGAVASGTLSSMSWNTTCYDTRGRPTTSVVRAYGTQSSDRTVTYAYSVGSNPLVSSISDAAGTITVTVDLLGRTTSYTDVWGKTTTTTYDQAGRATDSTGPGGTLHNDYNSLGQVTALKDSGSTIATPSYDSVGRLDSVSYANGTSLASLASGRDSLGRATTVQWNLSGSTATDQVSRTLAGRIRDESLDGVDANPTGDNFVYDSAGRLTTGSVQGHTMQYDYSTPTSTNCASPSSLTANKNTNRTTSTDVPSSGGPVSASTYCYDSADRLISYTTGGQTYSQRVAADQPVSYWRLAETSGTSATDGGSAGITGTYSGSTYTLNQAGAPIDETNASASFAGGKMTAGDNHDFTGTSAFTFELWARPSSLGWTDLITKAAFGSNGWYLYTDPSGSLYFGRAVSGTNVEAVGSSALAANTWAHVVGTYDGATLRLYVNGTQVATASDTRLLPGNSMPLTIAESSDPSYSYPFSGRVDEVAVYSSALPAHRVKAHYNGGGGASAATVVPTYDTHGNTVTLGDQTMGYDGADRHTTTWTPSSANPNQTVTYTRDATDRIVQRQVTTVGPVAYRDESHAGTGSGTATSLSLSKPSGAQVGDVMLATVVVDGGTGVTVSTPTGWVSVADVTNGTSLRTATFRRVVASGDTSWSFTLSTAKKATGAIVAYSGVDTTSPVDVSATSTAASSTSHTTPSVTTTGGWRSVVAMTGVAASTTLAPTTSGLTERSDQNTTGSGAVTLEVADRRADVAGSTGTSATTSAAAGVDAAVTVALKPASVTTTQRYSFAGGSDSPVATLDGASTVIERTIGLPGGVSVTKRSGGDVWSYTGFHGDVICTANSSGTKTGTYRYDPYGQAINASTGALDTQAQPDNSEGAYDNGWLGSAQRGAEHQGQLATIEMGARQYQPALGRFLEVDPVEGGSANDYDYVSGEPLTTYDTSGRWQWKHVVYTSYRLYGWERIPGYYGWGAENCSEVPTAAGVSMICLPGSKPGDEYRKFKVEFFWARPSQSVWERITGRQPAIRYVIRTHHNTRVASAAYSGWGWKDAGNGYIDQDVASFAHLVYWVNVWKYFGL